MKHLEEGTVQLPKETVPVQEQTTKSTDEQERQFWLDAKYSDAPCDSDR